MNSPSNSLIVLTEVFHDFKTKRSTTLPSTWLGTKYLGNLSKT